MSDETTNDQRLRILAGSALDGYRIGTVSLRKLIDDLDTVWNGIESSAWGDELRGHWWTLEQIYSVALDRGELESVSSDHRAAIAEAVTGLEALLNSWPEEAGEQG